jgi:hypothetical protein
MKGSSKIMFFLSVHYWLKKKSIDISTCETHALLSKHKGITEGDENWEFGIIIKS